MLLIAFFVLCVLSVALAGGRLTELATLHLRATWALGAAAVLQLGSFVITPGGAPWLPGVLHLASYICAALFVMANARVPGVPLIGLGGALNFVAIAANGGVMPIRSEALTAAGLSSVPNLFHNSAVVAAPNLPFLGDIFAVPAPLPFHNVFSAGDVLIAVGAAVSLHRLCRSRLVPSGSGQFLRLRGYPGFVRLWGAQAASNLGDWVYSLAVATSLAARGANATTFALLLIVQVAPSAVVGLLGGPLVDRVSRKRLMIGSDVLRGLAVASLLVSRSPSMAHFYAVAFLLGVFGALFQPSFQASLPNLVPRQSLVAANAVVSTTFHVAVMAGPILGGTLVTHFGPTTAFGLNAASFGVSAFLVAGVRLPSVAAITRLESPGRALRDGFRYIAGSPLVRAIFAALAVVMLASAIRTPLEPLFILRTLGNRPQALGIVGGAWGLGMVLGSMAAPAGSRRWHRERMFPCSIALVGVAVLVASQQRLLSPVLLLWFVAGFGNGSGTVFYESLLQERVPDSLRGRVLAASEAILDTSFLAGAALAGIVGDRLGIRAAFVVSGALLLFGALFTRLAIGQPPRRAIGFDAAAEPTAVMVEL